MKIFNHLKLLMLVSLALTVATMTARNVDSRTAKTKAILFLNSQTGMRFNASNANVTLTHAEQSQVNTQMNDFYVFNYDGGGYVIVSGDDRAEEILGYGSGYFDMNNLPDNVAWWMDHYKEQIEYLLANPKLQVQTFGQQMSGMLRASNVPALLTCKWDQMYPYNKQCPIDYNSTYNSRSVTGAVATAMAQVMYYWKHPVKLPALDAYVLENTQFMMEALPDTTLNWNNCIDEYTSSFSSAQADAVACLMRYCGQAVHTQYSASYSYANNENMREAMIKFGYSNDATMKYRNDYNATDWHTMMQAELEAGRPILYGGWAGYDEHTFVVDGYNASTNKYHVNFGWSGSSNTYYALDAFTGDGYTFNENQKMIIGLCPAPEAYTCYTSDNTTLTYYYDTQRSTRPGTTYDLNTDVNEPGWRSDNISPSVTQVVFDPSFADARPTSTYYWFSRMSNLVSITGMEYLNTDSVTILRYMFSGCNNLPSLDVSHFNTANVTDMTGMFSSCRSLTSLDLSNFNTANVTDMSNMFYYCNSLTSLDLSSFNTPNVTNMNYMFFRCSELTTIYVGDGWSTEAVTSSPIIFSDCTSLVGGMGTTWNESNPKDKTYAHIDGGPSNPGYFTGQPTGPEAYAVYTSEYSTLTFYYDDQRSNRPGIATYGLNTGTEDMEWHDNPYFFTRVVFDPSFADARPTTTYRWFYKMVNLESITGIEYLNTDSVTNMSEMFHNCRVLASLDLSHFNTANVTTMYFMFANCRALTNLDLSSFNTDNVTTMECMFYFCSELTSVDLSSFTNARVTRTANMFQNCSALTTIYASSSWSLPANNYSFAMFKDCTSLVGGMGTTYDANHIDAAYAHIDGGPDNPGYFSEKVNFVPGDVNGDNNVNVADVTALISLVLSGNASAADYPAGDMNGDGNLNISDVTALISRVLGGA